MRLRHVVPVVLFGLTGSAMAGQVKLKKSMASAKSSHLDDSGISYEAKNIADGKASTVWVEGEDGSGLGSWVQIDLGESKSVTGLKLWNGNWYTWDFWERHNRIKDLKVEFSDGSTKEFTLTDEFKPESIDFGGAVQTDSIRLYVKSIYGGNTFNDTCLSEVLVFDGAPSKVAEVKSYAASSVYAADNDGNYEPVNVSDGLADSMWCEADAGDGSGQWLEFDFGGAKSVSKLRIINGNGYSFGMNMKANAATKATLTFDGGSPQTIDLKASSLEQTISLSPTTASKVRITFDEIRKGKEYNDLCVSEAAFLE